MVEPINRNAAAAARAGTLETLRHVSWGSIFLGLVIAIAIYILLGMLGVGLGLTIFDPTDPGGSMTSWGISSYIYMVLTQIIALFIGGYAAAHLAPSPTNRTAMFHGLSIWALVTIVMLWLASTAVGGILSGATGAVSGIASATGKAVGAVVPEDFQLPDLSYQALPNDVRETLRQNNISPQQLRDEIRGAYQQVVSDQERQQLMSELRATVGEIIRNPGNAAQAIDEAVNQMFGEGGILSQQDLQQMQETLQQRLNLSDQEAQQIRTQLEQSIDQARQALSGSIQQAQDRAAKAADAVAAQIGFAALWMFLASVLGLIAAVVGGRMGEVKARY